jgi:hypothetical protein
MLALDDRVPEAYCATSAACEARKANGQPCTSSSDDDCLGYCDVGDDATNGVCAGGGGSSGQIVAPSALCTENFGVESSSTNTVMPTATGGVGSGGTGATGGTGTTGRSGG